MAHLSISLLGPMQVSLNQRIVSTFKTVKVRALLAYLAVEATEVQERAELASMLWPSLSDKAARNNLRQSLFRLRQAVQDRGSGASFLDLSRHTVQFNEESSYWLDVSLFKQLVHQSRTLMASDEEKGIQQLIQAVNLYQGDFLSDFDIPDSSEFQHWVYTHRENLHRLATDSLYTLIQYYESRGEYQVARQYSEKQVAIEPLNEDAHRQLIHILALQGERDAAIAQYEQCCQILRERLGVTPGRATLSLQQRILQGELANEAIMMAVMPLDLDAEPAEDEDEAFDFPPESLKTMGLPAHTTPFIGYGEETAAVVEMLQNPACRLLTVTGLVGSGKSSVALEVAWQLQDEFEDGVCFVNLTKVHTVDALLRRIADGLGVRTASAEVLFNVLSEKRLLLVLDGFDSVRGETVFLRSLMRQAPQVLLLITARSRLNVPYEWIYELGGLGYPSQGIVTGLQQYPAVSLFIQAAQRQNHNFEVSLDCWPHIARVARAVEGNPLALRQAATWSSVLDCHEIATEIEETVGFLNTSVEAEDDTPSDLQLRFEEFWQLLTNEQQRALRHLSVFKSNFTQEAAEAVAQLPLVELFVLKGQSLLQRVERNRYRLPVLLRHLAYNKLCERPFDKLTAETRFANHYAQFVRKQATQLQGPEQLMALNGFEQEMVHIKRMWEWAIDRCHHETLNLALDGIAQYYLVTDRYAAGEEQFKLATQRFVNLDDNSHAAESLLGRLLAAQGRFVHLQDRAAEAKRLLKTSMSFLQTHRREQALVQSLNYLADSALAVGDYGETQCYLQQSLEYCKVYDDLLGAADAMMIACEMSAATNDWDGARDYGERSLMLRRMAEDSWGMTACYVRLGQLAAHQKDYVSARQWYEQGLQLSQEVGRDAYAQVCYNQLNQLVEGQHISDESLAFYAPTLPLSAKKQLESVPA